MLAFIVYFLISISIKLVIYSIVSHSLDISNEESQGSSLSVTRHPIRINKGHKKHYFHLTLLFATGTVWIRGYQKESLRYLPMIPQILDENTDSQKPHTSVRLVSKYLLSSTLS